MAPPNPAPPAFISRQVLQGDYYFLDMEPRRRAALTVACGGREVCGPEYSIDRDGFRYLSIEYVDAGRGRVTIAGRTYPLRPGVLFSYGPAVPHRIEVDSGPPMVKYFVDFAGQAAARLLASPPWADPRPLRVAEPARLRSLFDELQRVGQRAAPHSRRLCALVLEQVLLVAADDALPADTPEPQGWQTYNNCRRYLEQHCLALHSLGDLAAACGVGQAHLCRLFKRYGQASPYQVLLELKMARAAVLLLDPRWLVREAGAAVGFDDPYHFSKAFKRAYGVSPEAFRSRGRGGARGTFA